MCASASRATGEAAIDFNDLSPEIREKARNCKTTEDILELAKKEGYELSDKELEDVAGGIKWRCSDKTCSKFDGPCQLD